MAQSQAFTLLPDPFRLDSSGTMTVATASTQTNRRVKFDYETHSVESAKFPPDSPFYFLDLFPIVPEDQVSCIRDNKLPETVSSPGTGHVTRNGHTYCRRNVLPCPLTEFPLLRARYNNAERPLLLQINDIEPLDHRARSHVRQLARCTLMQHYLHSSRYQHQSSPLMHDETA